MLPTKRGVRMPVPWWRSVWQNWTRTLSLPETPAFRTAVDGTRIKYLSASMCVTEPLLVATGAARSGRDYQLLDAET